VALQDIDGVSFVPAAPPARVTLPDLDAGRRAKLRPPGAVRAGRSRGMRLPPPSGRLRPTKMSRATFVRLTAIWFAAVVAVLAIALALRWFG
jgi:hypothetical protein